MRRFAVAAIAALAGGAWADTIKLKSGETLQGVTVLIEKQDSVLIAFNYSTVRLDRSHVVSIEKAPEEAPKIRPRLANWKAALAAVARCAWAADLRQIPATVIDRGVLRHVPYLSHRSGDYEFNIYGDPDRPACLEIGVYRELRRSEEAKKECVEAMARLLGDEKDVEALRALKRTRDKKVREGLTLEVTPETAPDAYGGWWISVYDASLLEEQRVDPKEVGKVAEKRQDLPRAQAPPPPGTAPGIRIGWTQDDLPHARPDLTGNGLIWIRGYCRAGRGYVPAPPPKK